jgi:hypothetical protein
MNNKFLLAGLLLLCAAVIIAVILIMKRSKQQISGALRARLWGIVALVVVLLLGNIGVTAARFADTETSTNNTIQVKTNWYNLAWHYRKAITIDHTKVIGAVQSGFTVLISRTDPNWAMPAAGHPEYHGGQADGGDFVFTAADGMVKLNHEIEKYNPATGELIAWVMIDALSNTADTVIYVYYGNASCSDQWSATGVWDTNTKAVWHMKENPAGTAPQIHDSTTNTNNGTTAGGMTSGDQVTGGKIDGSIDFEGTDDCVTVADSNSLSIGTAVTLSAWINTRSNSGTHDIIAKWEPTNSFLGLFTYGANQEYRLYLSGPEIGVGASSGTAVTSGAGLQANTWYHIEMVWSGGSAVTVYKNGVSLGALTLSSYPDIQLGGTADPLTMAEYNSGNYFNGIIDETRVSMTARSAGWIQTEYNNQNSPDTFVKVGVEE